MACGAEFNIGRSSAGGIGVVSDGKRAGGDYGQRGEFVGRTGLSSLLHLSGFHCAGNNPEADFLDIRDR